MSNIRKFKAKICYTASGILIHQGKILLVKHKKLGIWLPPGGHIEKDELAHEAAEREFWEETGIKVKALDRGVLQDDDHSKYFPVPISVNLHWISKENYEARNHSSTSLRAGNLENYKKQKGWERGCEQHYNLQFLVEPVDDLNFKQNTEETDGIGWFEQSEIDDLETMESIRTEIENAFKLIQ